ncbi:MAG: lipopolysaccharide biosynthesis protein [Methylovulum sp.]|uniref:lipopolysaccharide biosynthesis protein n=1 Tax=Methylovulum sp. TaxID=1916980 RepID=UPI0026287467|nr:lipopolysaccharide biosynthesis protein [Methylovulum sp.]MDD2725377.1 lipopolysaccharide biosynthesis protein [Methylovulum sp.]MDD5126291.1 lipopolysaccharide biosynthesis protein [Methylovulum sp.]
MFKLLKEKRLFGDAFWVLFGQLASAIALLAGTRILTELVTPEIYGQVALLNGFVALGVAVFSYPFICAGMRLLPECTDDAGRAALFSTVFRLAAWATGLAMVLLMLGGFVYSRKLQGDMWLFVLTGFLLAVTVRRELGIQLLIGGRKQRGASLWQTTDSILRPLLAIASVIYLGQKAEWVLSGYIAASFVSNTVWSLVFGRVGKAVLPTVYPAKGGQNSVVHPTAAVWAYALPLLPMELIFWLNGLGDRYVIGYFMTAADVGLYAATYLIINEAFNRSAMVLLRIFQPVYFQACAQNQLNEGFRILWLWIACVSAMGSIGVALLLITKDWVALLLLAQSYHPAVALMPAIAVGCALHCLGTVVSQPLLAKKCTRLMLLGRLSGVMAAAISIPLMVKEFGLLGAAMANPIYFGIEALVLAMLARPWRPVCTVNKDVLKRTEETAEILI